MHTETYAHEGDLMALSVKLRDEVKAGQQIGTICGLNGMVRQTLDAPEAGFIGMLRGFASVTAGDLIAQVFHRID